MWADLTIEPTLDEHFDGMHAINISERKIREELVQKHAIELKDEVDRKTRKLQNSIVELEKAQTQILKQSRLVTIGNLVSGVAHEIKPTEFSCWRWRGWRSWLMSFIPCKTFRKR